MSKAFIFGFIAGLALLIAVGVAGFQTKGKDVEQKKAQQGLALYKKEVVDATPTQFGVVNERQLLHSKLYRSYKGQTDKRISELIASQLAVNPYTRVVGKEFTLGLREIITEPDTPENYFGKLARESDAIIRGRVIKKASQITEDQTFIFTDYEVAVVEILKNNVASPLNTGTTITVTRAGGKIVVNDIVVKIKDYYFEPLPIKNEVVLFLRYVPETAAYKATRSAGSFELDGSILRPLTGDFFPPGVLQDSASFLQTIRSISHK